MMIVRHAVLLTTVVSLLAGGVAYSADAPKPPSDCKIGIVDINRVEDEFTEVKTATDTVSTMADSLERILKMRQKYSLLTEQEFAELEKLTGTEKPTDADKARITEMTTKGDTLAIELETLRGKKDPTDQEKTRLNELTEMGRKATADIEARRASYATNVQAKHKELLDKLTEKMNVVIGELAKSKGLWAVLPRQYVMWGGIDLTTELIEKLNKDAKK